MSVRSNQVAIVDYEMGNLFSVRRACEQVGLAPIVTSDIKTIFQSSAIILPGVGAFGDAINNLKRLDLISPMIDSIASGKPFMGICLGFQLLMSESEEFGRHKGLDYFKGSVVKFPSTGSEHLSIKVPQVGWNRIYQPLVTGNAAWASSLLQGIKNHEYMYFVHSYYVVPEDRHVALSYTDYEGIEYTSSISLNNVFACQFHPEKSAVEGMKIYKNFAAMIRNKEGVS